jgi:hypothetical protein
VSRKKPPTLTVVPPMTESGQNPPEDEGEDDGLSARETRFCDALAAGRGPAEAAREINLSDRSGRRWRKKPEIVAAVRARLAENIATGKSILAAGMAKAATGLVAMASGKARPNSARVAACRAVTDGAVKLCELAELQAQLADLQQQIVNMPGGQRRNLP